MTYRPGAAAIAQRDELKGWKSPLTGRQREGFEYLVAYIAEHGQAPTHASIAAHLRVSSPASVNELLARLTDKGWITRGERNTPRSITIVDAPEAPPPPEPATKVCTKCKRDLPTVEFVLRTYLRRFQPHCRECRSASRREYVKRTGYRPTRLAEHRRRFRTEHREKAKAHSLVLAATQRGDLVRPSACSSCGNSTRVEAHHEDYTKPLVVTWLCSACHVRVHMEQRRALRDVAEQPKGPQGVSVDLGDTPALAGDL